MANLDDGTGKHVVDPGPTFFAKAPVFGTGFSGKLVPVRVDQVDGIGFGVYRIDDGPDAIEILFSKIAARSL